MLSPFLFNMVIDKVFRTLQPKLEGVQWVEDTTGRQWQSTAVAYADDVALFAPSRAAMQRNLDKLATHLAAVQLTVSVKKTKYMVVGGGQSGDPEEAPEALDEPPPASEPIQTAIQPSNIHASAGGPAGGPATPIDLTHLDQRTDEEIRNAVGDAIFKRLSATHPQEAARWSSRLLEKPLQELTWILGHDDDWEKELEDLEGGGAPPPPVEAEAAAPSKMFVLWNFAGPQQCPVCHNTLKTQTSMKNHLWRVHQEDATVGKAPLKMKLVVPQMGQDKNQCPKCRQQFSDSSGLTKHYKRGVCDRGEQEAEQSICRYCGGKFTSKALTGHQRYGECGKKHAAAPRCTAMSSAGKQCVRKVPCAVHPAEEAQCQKCGKKLRSLQNHKCGRAELEYAVQFQHAPAEVPQAPAEPQPEYLTLYGEKLELVHEFRYLGRVISDRDDDSADVAARLQVARGTVARLYNNVFRPAGITTQTKVAVFRTVCTAQVRYGSETWSLSRQDEGKLRAFQQSCLRRATRTFPTATYDDDGKKQIRMPKREEVLAKAGLNDIVREVEHGQLRWYGHVLRMDDESEVKRSFGASLPGRGAPGFVNEHLVTTQMERRMQACGLQKKDAADREKWRTTIERTRKEDVREGEAKRERPKTKCGAATRSGAPCQQHKPCRHHPGPPPTNG